MTSCKKTRSKAIPPQSIIPQNDITVSPKKVYEFISSSFDFITSTYDHNPDYTKLLIIIKKEFLKEFKKTFFWNTEVLSHKTCMHVFKEKSKKFGTICNKRIDISEEKNYYCSEHIGIIHKDNIKKRNIQDHLRCKGINKNGKRCELPFKKNGYFCGYHFKEEKVKELEEELIIKNKIIVNNSIKNNLEKEYMRLDNDHYVLYIEYLSNLYIDYYKFVEEESIKREQENINYLNNNKPVFKKLYNEEIIENNTKFESLSKHIEKLKKDNKELNKIYNIYDIYKNDYININGPTELFETVCAVQNHLNIFLEENNFKNKEDIVDFINKYKDHKCYNGLPSFNIKDLDKEDMKNIFKNGIKIYTENYYEDKNDKIEYYKKIYNYIKKYNYIKYNKDIDKNIFIKKDIEKLFNNICLIYEDIYYNLKDPDDREEFNVLKDNIYNCFNNILDKKDENENYI